MDARTSRTSTGQRKAHAGWVHHGNNTQRHNRYLTKTQMTARVPKQSAPAPGCKIINRCRRPNPSTVTRTGLQIPRNGLPERQALLHLKTPKRRFPRRWFPHLKSTPPSTNPVRISQMPALPHGSQHVNKESHGITLGAPITRHPFGIYPDHSTFWPSAPLLCRCSACTAVWCLWERTARPSPCGLRRRTRRSFPSVRRSAATTPSPLQLDSDERPSTTLE